MGRLPRQLLAIATITVVWLFASPAFGQSVAGLAVDFDGDFDSTLQDELVQVVEDTLGGSPRFDWIPTAQARQRLEPVVRDCFTDECLQAAGDALNAEVGLQVSLSVESEIYEWTVEFFDLVDGGSMGRDRGVCELCGRAELLENFQASIRAPLAMLDVEERHMGPIDTGRREIPEGSSAVRVSVIPTDTRIFLDEAPAGIGDAEIILEPGTYELRFSHDERRGLRDTLVISDTSPEVIFIRLHLSEPGGGERQVILTRGDGWIDQIEANRTIYGWSALGIGAVMVASSFFFARLHGQPTCPDTPLSRCPDIYNTAGLAMGLAVLGTAGVVGGGTLLAWPRLAGEEREDAPEASLQLNPTVGVGFGGFSLSGRF